MIILEFLAFIMMCVAIVFDIKVLGIVAIGLFVLFELIALIQSVAYSQKTFVCMTCGKEFTVKWSDLLRTYRNWGVGASGETVTTESGTYKKLWVHCRHCGGYDCGIKMTDKK